jgi:group I intron endonuclease
LSAFFKGKVYPERAGEKNPFFGKTHSDENRKKISEAKTGLRAAFFGKKHSAESRKKISDAKLGQVKPVGSGRPCRRIEVFDNKNNSTTIYDSIRAAARALNMDGSLISSYLKRNQQKPYKGQYIFKQV